MALASGCTGCLRLDRLSSVRKRMHFPSSLSKSHQISENYAEVRKNMNGVRAWRWLSLKIFEGLGQVVPLSDLNGSCSKPTVANLAFPGFSIDLFWSRGQIFRRDR